MLRKFILATTFLVPLSALADDEFGISEEPVKKEAPASFNSVEIGIGHSSDNPLSAGRYNASHETGVLPLGNFNYLYRTPQDGKGSDFLRMNGSAFGTETRRFSAEGGEQGSYKLLFGYETLNYSDFTGLTPFVNEGTGNLRTVPGWTKGGSTSAINKSKLEPVDIRTTRERFGSGMTWQVDQEYSVRMAARHEEKEGLKTRGVGLSGSLATVVPEPVNYQDDRVEAELGYAGKTAQWRLGYQLSMFKNEDDSLTMETPFSTHAKDRMALAPDNTAHSFYVDGGYQFTDTTRLTTNLSYSDYLQDEAFLPYSINQTAGRKLPRSSLEGRIRTTTGNVELATRPLAKLESKTRYRFTDRHNDTPIDQFFYISMDGTGAAAGDRGDPRRRRNTPYSYKENLATQDFGYSLSPRTKVLTGYEFRTFQRDYSERARNIDNTGYLGMRASLAEGLSANTKYSHTWRDGSTYSPTGSLAFTNNQAWARVNKWDNHKLLRKYYEADLVRDRIQAGLTYAPTEALSVGLSGGLLVDEYVRSELGLTDSVGTDATIDVSYTVSPELTLNGFYTYERRTTDQAGLTGFSKYTANRWYVSIADDAHTTGLGTRWQVREGLALLFDYTFAWTVSEVETKRDGNWNGTTLAASSFPDITSRSNNFSIRAEYDLTDNVVLGLGYALELYRSRDWAYDDVSSTTNSVLGMSEESANYDAHLFLVTTRYKF